MRFPQQAARAKGGLKSKRTGLLCKIIFDFEPLKWFFTLMDVCSAHVLTLYVLTSKPPKKLKDFQFHFIISHCYLLQEVDSQQNSISLEALLKPLVQFPKKYSLNGLICRIYWAKVRRIYMTSVTASQIKDASIDVSRVLFLLTMLQRDFEVNCWYTSGKWTDWTLLVVTVPVFRIFHSNVTTEDQRDISEHNMFLFWTIIGVWRGPIGTAGDKYYFSFYMLIKCFLPYGSTARSLGKKMFSLLLVIALFLVY